MSRQKSPPSKNPGDAAPRRTLMVTGPSLAQGLLQLPALSSLAKANRATLLGSEEQMAVLDPSLLKWRLSHQGPESLSQPISLEIGSTDAQTLRRYDFSHAVFLGAHGSASRKAARAGIPERWGDLGWWRGRHLSHRVATADEDHLSDSGQQLLQNIDVPWDPQPLHVSETWQRTGKERLASAKISTDESLVAVYVGNEGALGGGLWPTEFFEELIQKLRRNDGRRRFLILSTDHDLWQSVLLFERTGKIHPVIGPDLNLDGLAGVLFHLDLVVAGDSSLLQLAYAVGAPTLGLYRKDSERCIPAESNRHQILERNPLKRLSVDEVAERCEAALAAKPGLPQGKPD